MGLYELLTVSEALKQQVHTSPSMDALRRQAVQDGMRPLRLAGALRVAEGVTTLDEVMASTPDRKSTRLNSSHSQISYAVFCLKKKKCGASHTRRCLHRGRQRPRHSGVVSLLGQSSRLSAIPLSRCPIARLCISLSARIPTTMP